MAKEWLRNSLIKLRSPEPEDLELMYRMENDTELWSSGSTTLPYSRHTLRSYLEQTRQDLYSERQARFVIELADGKAAGMIDLVDFDPHNLRAEVCIGLLGEYRNKGIGKESLALLCDYAINFLHLHQLYTYIETDNHASIALFCGAGFKETARMKDWLKSEKEYLDVLFLQLIK